MKIKNRENAGFTLVEVMIVSCLISLLAIIAVPNFIKARSSGNKSVCIANLKQLSDAKTTWAMEKAVKTSDKPVQNDLVGVDKYIRVLPKCPSGGADYFDALYIGTAVQRPSCSLEFSDQHKLEL